MIIRIESFSGEDNIQLKQAFDIRKNVLVDENGIDKFVEFDGLDAECVHYLVFYNETPIATVRWRETTEGIKIERFAVLKKFRRKAIGSLLIRYIIDELLPSKRTIYLFSLPNAINFFQSNGFKNSGEVVLENQVNHFRMEYINVLTR